MDLIVRDATVRGRLEHVDIAVDGGVIVSVGDVVGTATEEIDAHGGLVSPTFVEPHFHLDKCLTGTVSYDLPSLEAYIAAEIDRKREFTVEDVEARATTMIELLVEHGVTVIRSNVDVDSTVGLIAFEGVQRAAEHCRDIADVQLTAFPQQGIVRDPGTADLLDQALRRGATAVGGHPQLERSAEDSRHHIETVFDLAASHDADVDLHCDESDESSSRHIHDVAVETLRRGWQGRVAAGHVCALAYYDQYYADRVISLIREAEITVVCNPTSNLLFRALRHQEPKPRGLTRVRELIDAGVRVCFGQETVRSNYIVTLRHPDPLLTAQILAHGAQLKSLDDMEVLWDMATVNAAGALHLADYGLATGCRASFNVFEVADVVEAIATIAPRRYVVRDGIVIAENRFESVVRRAGG